MVSPPLRRVAWPQTHRIIRSIFPPIDLFEDIAAPEDWEAIASAEGKMNPRVNESLGNLSLVPPSRRVSGQGASWVMAPFVHCSPDRPSRFSDGSYGVYYAGDRVEVALSETIHHHQIAMAATAQEPGWTSQFRELVGSVDRALHDIGSVAGALHPSDYGPSQKLARTLRGEGSDGLVYPSVRHAGGMCIAIFWPDAVTIPVQGAHFAYHWNGERVDYIKELDTGRVKAVVH